MQECSARHTGTAKRYPRDATSRQGTLWYEENYNPSWPSFSHTEGYEHVICRNNVKDPI